MVKKNIYWSNLANTQLTDILHYYHHKAGNKFTNRLLENILHATSLLSNNPKLGFIEESLKNEAREYRSIVEGYYKIIYVEENTCIRIIVIFDCRQTPEKLYDFFKH